jgi:hypothetical protein
MPREKPSDPLIPMDELKKIVRGLAAVPKDAIGKPKPEPKKPKRS